MAQSQHTPQSWLDTAVRDIPGKAERRAVWAELSGHIQERMDSLQQTFPGLSPEEIQARALAAMGDAEEIGRALARVHSPWEPVSPSVWEGMEARDDRGNTLPYVDAGAGVWADGLLGGGVLEQSNYTQQVEFILPLPDPEAETVALGYSGLGEEVVLSLSRKEETP